MEQIFNEAVTTYQGLDKAYTFYFNIDEKRYTIFADEYKLWAEQGKKVENADCVCKVTSELFKKIWYENYKPGMKEIFSGDLKTNNPELLQKFLKVCGR